MNGVIYVAIGEQYLNEAKRSVESLKAHTGLHTTIFTDDMDSAKDHFDQVLPFTGDTNATVKARMLKKSPYKNTLFLDTDTYIMTDISHLFEILYRYDMAIAHAPRRTSANSTIPSWFPEMNSGVMLFRRNDLTATVLDWWLGNLNAKYDLGLRIRMDQPPLREALYSVRDLKLLILPPEYNVRLPSPAFVCRRAKILHGRGELLDCAIERINEHKGMRLWLPREKKLYQWEGEDS